MMLVNKNIISLRIEMRKYVTYTEYKLHFYNNLRNRILASEGTEINYYDYISKITQW